MTIDWTKPLELMDGTPLVFADCCEQGDPEYYLAREDGELFTKEQRPANGQTDTLVVTPTGTLWIRPDATRVLVRNRAEWGGEIEVNGVRPDWLRDGDKIRWSGSAKPQWGRGGTLDHILPWPAESANWPCATFIRLPVDHPYYTATEKGFTFWPGGDSDSAPADYNGGDILFRHGGTTGGQAINWTWVSHGGPRRTEAAYDVIGYHRKPVAEVLSQTVLHSVDTYRTTTVDWTKPIEAVRKSDGKVVPVTLESPEPDKQGFYTTVECPQPSETNRDWAADGKDRCHHKKWFVRNRAAVSTVTLETLTVADAEARMLDIPTLQELGLIVEEPVDRATELTREILAAGSEAGGSPTAARKYRTGDYDRKERFIATREIVARELAA